MTSGSCAEVNGLKHSDGTNGAGRGAGRVRREGRRLLATLVPRIVTSAMVPVLPHAVGQAQAQRLLQISGAKRTTVADGRGRQDRGRAHRCALHRHHGRRSGGRGRHAVDRPLAVDPRQEDRHDARHGLRRGQASRSASSTSRCPTTCRGSRPRSAASPAAASGCRRSTAASCSSGTAPDAVTLDRAVMIARQFAPEIINTVQVLQPQQVMLEVRFVEASRQAGRELGVQWNMFGQQYCSPISARADAARPAADHGADQPDQHPGRRSRRGRALRRVAVRLPARPHDHGRHHGRRC